LDGIPFHPYYSIHEILGIAGFLIVFCAIMFFAPEFGGYFLEFNNFIPADPLVTPPHIAPVWYFTPYYSMLRAVTDVFTWVMVASAALGAIALLRSQFPMLVKAIGVAAIVVLAMTFRIFDAKFWGVVIMGGAVVIMFFLPWLDKSPVNSIRYRPTWHKWLYGVFVVNFFILGYLGVLPPFDLGQAYSLVGTVFYFAFFALMPIWSRIGEFKPVPERVTFKPH
jgi:ubiquinol-cytochrome c reductase cytochrome b subunit